MDCKSTEYFDTVFKFSTKTIQQFYTNQFNNSLFLRDFSVSL